MPVSAQTLRLLIGAGLDGEALIEVVASIDADIALTPARSAGAVRQQRYRGRQKDRDATSDVTSPETKVSPTPPSKTQPIHPPSPPKGGSSPQAALEAVLSPERAAAVIAHRKALRRRLTVEAARLLAGKLAEAPDPNAAADAMIANGWQGFEAEWLENRRGRAGANPPPQTFSDIARRGVKGFHGTDEYSGPTLDLAAEA